MAKKDEKKKDSILWARQYSKRLITFIFCVWGIGAVVGGIYEFLRLIITPDTASMESLYLYLAVPMTGGVTSYLIANTLLNREKVKQNYIPDYDSTVLCGEYADGDGIGTERLNIAEGTSDTGFHADIEALPGAAGPDYISGL